MRGKTNALIGGGGGGSTPTEEVTVQAVEFPTVVEPRSGYALSKATVTAPDNLEAGNIKSGVSIAGVTGTYEGAPVDSKWMKIIKSRNLPNSDVTEGYDIYEADWEELDNCIPMYLCNDARIRYLEIPEGGTIGDSAFRYSGPTKIGTSFSYPKYIDIVFKGKPAGITYPFDYIALEEFPASYIEACGSVILAYLFRNIICYEDEFIVPEGITEIGNYGLVIIFKNSTTAATKTGTLTLPTTLTKLTGYNSVIFANNRNYIILQLKSTIPPTLTSASTSYKPAKIIVPAGTLEAYQTATNWATYADLMEEATE